MLARQSDTLLVGPREHHGPIDPRAKEQRLDHGRGVNRHASAALLRPVHDDAPELEHQWQESQAAVAWSDSLDGPYCTSIASTISDGSRFLLSDNGIPGHGHLNSQS
jgi:hypothetical protein